MQQVAMKQAKSLNNEMTSLQQRQDAAIGHQK